MTPRSTIPGLFGRSLGMLGMLGMLGLTACEKATVAPDDANANANANAEPAKAEPQTPEQSCARMLSRFGEDVAEAETDACVAALTSGSELEVCKDAGSSDDYLACFDSCMGSVGIDPEEYDPGDNSTSPVVNCVAGCFSTSCE